MLKKALFLIPLVIVLLSIPSCARRGSISGGPKDTIAPQLLFSYPKNLSTNFTGSEIKLQFNEYIKLKDLQKQLVVSPPMNSTPEILPQTASKTLTIRIKDTLKPNTTYSFNFGQSIQDNNEGNPYPQFKYVMSTGPTIDSLKLGVKIKDALERKTDNFVSVMLYEVNAAYQDSIVYKKQPQLILLEIDPEDATSGLSLHFISELHRYLNQLPKVIVTTKNDTLCLQAFKYGIFDYLIHPVESKELRKTFMRFEKEHGIVLSKPVGSPVIVPPVLVEKHQISTETKEIQQQLEEENKEEEDVVEEQEPVESTGENEESVASMEAEDVAHEPKDEETPLEAPKESSESVVVQAGNATKPLVICVKSYGDYRYIDAAEICYLQADNNSTDIHLNTGEMITAFKTLKHFEGVLTHPFVRIHNSYIVNIDYIGRIHTGNSVCHLKNSTVKLPFSKSYKENIDQIINSIASGNYLEI